MTCEPLQPAATGHGGRGWTYTKPPSLGRNHFVNRMLCTEPCSPDTHSLIAEIPGAFRVVADPWVSVEKTFAGLAHVVFVGEGEEIWPRFLREWEAGVDASSPGC